MVSEHAKHSADIHLQSETCMVMTGGTKSVSFPLASAILISLECNEEIVTDSWFDGVIFRFTQQRNTDNYYLVMGSTILILNPRTAFRF